MSDQAARPPVSPILLCVYNVVFFFGLVLYLPIFLWKLVTRSSSARGFRERMGFVQSSGDRDVLWVHGVSVGEVKAARPLIEEFRQRMPELDIVVSSTTPTGAALARRIYEKTGIARVIFYPLDFWRFPRRSLDRVRPCCVLLMELELWPNFLNAAERRGVPVAVVNGRISERSYRGYRRVSWLLPQLDRIDLFAVQNESYSERLSMLGVTRSRIVVTGNIKYDSLTLSERGRDAELEGILARNEGDVVFVAGSTHADEELQLARAARALEDRIGRCVRLVVAPRHPERCAAVREEMHAVLAAGGPEHAARNVSRLTHLREEGDRCRPGSWLVIDTIGELEKVYSLADVVFVGGSLVKHGGQNMLEPVALGRPTVVGPNLWNFATDVELLLAGGGLVKVENADELVDELEHLLAGPEACAKLVENARAVIAANQGASRRTCELVLDLLADRAPELEAWGSADMRDTLLPRSSALRVPGEQATAEHRAAEHRTTEPQRDRQSTDS